MEERHALMLISKAHSGYTLSLKKKVTHGIKRERLVAKSMVAAMKVVRHDQHQNQCQGGSNIFPHLKGQSFY